MKTARGAGRTPFQVLADFGETGDVADLERFKEWTRGMAGARQLTYSRALRERYLGRPEKTDAEIVADGEGEGEELLATIPSEAWGELLRADPDISWRLLDVAEAAGADAGAALADLIEEILLAHRRRRAAA